MKVTPIFSFSPLFLCKNRLFVILCTLLSNVGNMASPKMCAYPKSALTGAFWPKLFCLGNQTFFNGAFVARRPFLLLDPSQYLFSFSSNGHLSAELCFFFLKIFTRPHCGKLFVVNSPCVLSTLAIRAGLEMLEIFNFIPTRIYRPGWQLESF